MIPSIRRALAVGLSAAAFFFAEANAHADTDKRALPDYDGRGNPDADQSPALWIPRILLSPFYFVTEFLIRRPLGFLISSAERSGLPGLLYDFFIFGEDHKAGVVPIGFFDFGFVGSAGVYAFWDDAFVHGHDLVMHATTGGTDWLSASIAERFHLSKHQPLDAYSIELSGIRRPDLAYFGMGPRAHQDDRMRFGSSVLEARTGVDQRLWHSSSFTARVGVRSNHFHHGHFGSDPSLDEQVAAGNTAAPPGLELGGYTIGYSRMVAAFDTRRLAGASQTGFRLELEGMHSTNLRDRGSWVRYGGTVSAGVDVNGRGRVISVSATTRFVDPINHAEIPFTELVTLGGDEPMRAYLRGRLFDRSAAVGELAYRWPIWVWLEGAMRFEVGNVFGPGLEGFSPGLLRFSGSIGVESRTTSDNAIQVLFGLGSEPFDEGAKIDAVRFLVGTTHGF